MDALKGGPAGEWLWDETTAFARTKLGAVVLFTSLLGLAPVAVVLGVKGSGPAGWWVLGLVLAFDVLLIVSIHIRTRVRPGAASMRFWFLPAARFDPADVEGLEVVRFDPLTDFGGWGFKPTRKHGRAYCLAGREGVRLRVGGKRYVIGSKDAAGLALALAEAGAEAPASLEPVSVKEAPRYAREPSSGS